MITKILVMYLDVGCVSPEKAKNMVHSEKEMLTEELKGMSPEISILVVPIRDGKTRIEIIHL